MKDLCLEKILIDGKLVDIKRQLNLIILSFKLSSEEKLFFHIQCYFRLFDLDRLIITSEKIHTPDRALNKGIKLKSFKWYNSYETVFDAEINKYRERLSLSLVQNVCIYRNDIRIIFENGMSIDVLESVTEVDDKDYSENYRIFFEDKTKNYYIV